MWKYGSRDELHMPFRGNVTDLFVSSLQCSVCLIISVLVWWRKGPGNEIYSFSVDKSHQFTVNGNSLNLFYEKIVIFTSLEFFSIYLARVLLSDAEAIMMIFMQVLRTDLSPKYIFFSKSNTFLMKDLTIYLKLEKKTNLFQRFKLKSSLF